MWLAPNALWTLIVQSDGISKTVLLLLLGMSVLCWMFFLTKSVIVGYKQKQINSALRKIDQSMDITDLVAYAKDQNGTVDACLIARMATFLNTVLKGSYAMQGLSAQELDMVLNNLDQTIVELVEKEREYLSVISTAAGVAPLLGLFGTVWGLIHAFIRISERQVADISTVAPGIAEALITTLAGLLVAIPALVMFNILAARVRSFEVGLQALADRIAVIVEYSLMIRKMNATYQKIPTNPTHERSVTHSAG